MPFADLKNHKSIYYEQYGQGDHLILMSGFTADHSVWSAMIGELAKFYRVLVFDNPGVGRSYLPQPFYSLKKMSEDVLSLLNFLDIQSANFIGHSMGASLLMQLCIDHPDRVKQAVLCGGPAVVPITAKMQINALQYAIRQRFPDEYIFLSILPWLYGSKFLNDKTRLEMLRAKMKANLYPQTLAGFEAQCSVLNSFDHSSHLKEIQVKCLIISAIDDLLIPTYCSKFLGDNIPNSKLKILKPGIGHMFHVEEHEIVSKIILQFLHPKHNFLSRCLHFTKQKESQTNKTSKIRSCL